MKTIIKIWFLWCIIFSILIYTPSNAIAVDVGDLLGGTFNADSRDDRIEMAKSIKAKIEILDSYLPNVKPSEKEWIEREEADIEKIKDSKAANERFLQLYESPEYQQLELKGIIDELKDRLMFIANKKVKLKDEMLFWAIVNFNLSNTIIFNDSILILKRHGRLPKDIAQKADLTSEDAGYGARYNWFGRSILKIGRLVISSVIPMPVIIIAVLKRTLRSWRLSGTITMQPDTASGAPIR